MYDFIAKNSKQLDICLRLLYAEGQLFSVSVQESAKGKIFYVIAINADDETKKILRDKYRIMIS